MYDVIVVGAGGGGGVIAKELAEQGLDILLLEGGRSNEDTDNNYSHFEGHNGNPVTGITRNGPDDPNRSAWYRETPQNSFIWDASGVGGTTQSYFGACPRAHPGSFIGFEGDGNKYDTDHLFPFSYDELAPYYEWVEKTLPVNPAAMSEKEKVFIKGCKKIGLELNTDKDIIFDSYRPNPSSILQPGGNSGKTSDTEALRYPNATGCTMCGYCNVGCNLPKGAPRNLKAKRSTHNSYIPMALTAGLWSNQGKSITLKANAYVINILTEDQATLDKPKATGVRWRNTQTGQIEEASAKTIVLAAGCIETPRLWLRSQLPNPNQWVGKGLTDHSLDWVVALYDEPIHGDKGYTTGIRADFPGRGGLIQVALGPAFLAFTLNFSDNGVRKLYSNGQKRHKLYGAWDGPSGRLIGADFKELLQNHSHVSSMLIMTDDDVEEQNQVSLSEFVKDEHGSVARAKLGMRNRSRRTLKNRRFLANKAAQIFRAGGAKKVFRIDWPGMMLHMQSSMRMGIDEENSVLDNNAEARWVDALYVADNSALANGAGGSNPTITTQALATRTAEKLAEKYFGIRPWVGTRTPVSSIDDRVTEGVLSSGIK